MQSLNRKEITSLTAAARSLLRSALFMEVYVLFFVEFKELKIRFGWKADCFTTDIVPTSEFCATICRHFCITFLRGSAIRSIQAFKVDVPELADNGGSLTSRRSEIF